MPACRHAILFVTPFDADTWAVDRWTGRHGFGHVALWSGIVEGGQPIVLDSSLTEQGVTFRPLLDMTRGVPYATLELDDKLGQWMLARAIRCVGQPYDYGGLLRGRVNDDAFTCSGLLCCALPVQLERRCRPAKGPVSPNDLARGLGVPKWSRRP
jgi:hypothetical protein